MASASAGLAEQKCCPAPLFAAAAAAAVVFAAALYWRRRRPAPAAPLLLKQQGPLDDSWEIGPAELEICRYPDGREWVLGEGQSGRVFKAMRNGIQVGGVDAQAPEALASISAA